MPYVGRFAPSPTGPLHAGSLVAALASWLDARAHGGRWLVRIENVDRPRCVPGAAARILQQLARCGLVSDGPVWVQSTRDEAYEAALRQLRDGGQVFDCGCSRRDIDAALAALGVPPSRHAERPYPGTCRNGLDGRPARAVRLRVGRSDGAPVIVDWHDRRLGPRHQDVAAEVGDFVLRRADGLWAYQLAVVVDDAAQGITDVVRGEDLADNTPRQILLQRHLGLPTPRHLHTPLVLGPDGHKLSKQNGAAAPDLRDPLVALARAAQVLGLPEDIDRARAVPPVAHIEDWLGRQVARWHHRWVVSPSTGPSTMNTTPSGLGILDTVTGSGDEAAAGQRVQVHYTGWLHDPEAENGRGRKFDSSKDRGQPFAFHLGGGQVIRGWDEGVQGMRVGGTRVLTIPPDLGYGARGAGGVIPPNATLVFEVELLGT